MYSKGAKVALTKCMGLKNNENILIITDSKKSGIAGLFLKEAKKITKKCLLKKIPLSKVHGQEPPKDAAKLMKKFDVVLLITTKSLSHTKARKSACKAGARIASMPGITTEMLKTLDVNYEKIKKVNKNLQKLLTTGKTARVTTKKGTDITMSIKGRKCLDDNGMYNKPGSFGNLPAGEVCLAPLEGTSNGIFIADGSFGTGTTKPIKITVKEGYAIDIDDKKVKKIFFGKEKDLRNIAELGIGTNDKAKIRGIVLEDEKVKGTVHIALGNNASYGGKVSVPLHIDGVILKPSLWIDRRQIMKEGKLQEKLFK